MIIKKDKNFTLENPNTANISLAPEVAPINKPFDKIQYNWLYVLKLEKGKYYVGVTRYSNPYNRIMQHVDGFGAKWTSMYKPLEVVEIRDIGRVTQPEAKAMERNLTAEYMKIYGVNNVRGGIFNYPGRIIKVGDRIIMGYMLSTFLLAFIVILQSIYILLVN